MKKVKNSIKLLNFVFAVACGVMVANLYYAQPILANIADSLHISIKDIAFITTITQIGYAIGLFFLVPLLDVIENKRLIIFMMFLNVLALFFMSISEELWKLIFMSLLIGISASSVQMIVPFGASMVPPENRGVAVGKIMSGLLFGIMLARPLSSFFSGIVGWQEIFLFSAGLGFVLVGIFLFVMPSKKPLHKMNYFKLLFSMMQLFKNTPILRQRGFYHFLAFGVFCLFWIVAPLVLIESFGFSNNQVALFAFIGIMGVFVAPFAGRLADRGKSEWATGAALLAVGISMFLAVFPMENRWNTFVWLAFCGVILDFGVSLNLVVGQRIIYALGDSIRARLNALYMVMFFIGGAMGSYLGGYLYAHFGGKIAFFAGGIIGILGFLAFMWNLIKARLK
ncbi:MFS transporter [Helicobacter cappadocius]|uniref:MFS transporter n=1 Tax=Helicobacter cappadocius TaxID=3063998 RepID=A0AA90PI11_9HELI|nr:MULTISPECIES: MFS transporter [unclassified Helicobacter]MDO7252319.1 MFS transporter [Helicobacter sp. faydin-H75]MDP2538186.1 MFS transporter [Helicobacter sp. faydin-H76]